MTKKKTTAAVGVAKRRRRNQSDGPVTLETGVQVRLLPVSISLINEAQAAIPNPDVPMYYIESKDISEPNYADPVYIKACEQAEADRNVAAIDATIMFGVRLENGLPAEDDEVHGDWLRMLRLRQKTGLTSVKLEDFDLDDDLDLEFLFKKYIAVSTSDLETLFAASNITQEDIAAASRGFRDNEE